MMDTQGFVLRKDGVGLWQVTAYTEFDGHGFTLETGERIAASLAFVCDPNNLAAAVRNEKKLTPPEGMMLPELDASQIQQHLKAMNAQLDSDWRIRHVMGDPFMRFTTQNVGPIIRVHEAFCRQNKKDPDAMPCAIALVGTGPEPEKIPLFAYLQPDGTGIPLPEGKDVEEVPGMNDGEIHLVTDRMGFQRVVLKTGDWYMYPKAQWQDAPVCVLSAMKWMPNSTPTNADSIQELVGPDRFLTPEGMLLRRGGTTMTLSVDDFLKDL